MYVPSLKEFIKKLFGDISLDNTMLSRDDWKYMFEKIEEVLLSKLSLVEQQVISYRFNLRGGGKMTLAGLGKELGVSPERARQREAESLRKLRYYISRDVWLKVTLGLQEACAISLDEFQKVAGGFWPPMALSREYLLSKPVSELELSVRSATCLEAANIKTVCELVQKTENEMMRYRNFGRKSLHELKDILNEMGLTFGMKLDSNDL